MGRDDRERQGGLDLVFQRYPLIILEALGNRIVPAGRGSSQRTPAVFKPSARPIDAVVKLMMVLLEVAEARRVDAGAGTATDV